MLRGILLDLDDTLYEYSPCNEAALRAVHEGPGAELGTHEEFRTLHDAVRRELALELQGTAASHNRMLFFKRMIERQTGKENAPLALAMYAVYWDRFLDRMRPAPDAHTVMAKLADELPLALVSNHTTEIQLRKVDRLGFTPYLKAIVTSEEIGVEKPAAAPFQAALDRLGIAASEALMVGDDPIRDLQGAQAVGLRTVWSVEFRKAQSRAGSPGEVISRLGELLEVVERLR